MTQAEYEKRNGFGYEGDTFVHEEIKKLVEKFKVNYIIETGTYLGATTKRLAEFCPVVSFEILNKNYVRALRNTAGRDNIKLVHSDSVKGLNSINFKSTESVLFFLDAHWTENCPLLDELRIISEKKIKPCIVIHDWKVPGKDFGFDSYNGQDFTFEWIEESLKKIYGNNFSFHYNDKADGGYRGLIYIYPSEETK